MPTNMHGGRQYEDGVGDLAPHIKSLGLNAWGYQRLRERQGPCPHLSFQKEPIQLPFGFGLLASRTVRHCCGFI